MKKNQPIRYTAASYDRFTGRYLDYFDENLVEAVLDEMEGMTRPRNLLDVGTGTAQVLWRLAGVPEMDAVHLVGLDFFQDVLDQANRHLAESGLGSRVSLLRGDVHALPVADQSLDLVISRSTIHHWAEPVTALAEIHRVLAPGGSAIIHEVRRDPPPQAIDKFNALRAKAGLPPSLLDDKYTPAQVAEMLEKAGIAGHCRLKAPEKGLAALGMEIRISRPADHAA